MTKTKVPAPSFVSTITPEDVVKILNSQKWRIAGSIAYIKRVYGLPKNDPTPGKPLIESASYEDHLLTISIDRKNIRFHINWIKLDRPAPGRITVGIIKEVSQQRSTKDGGGTHLVKQLTTQVVLEKQ